MDKEIIENGIIIPYSREWEPYIYWCPYCECYHVHIDTYTDFQVALSNTETLIQKIKDKINRN